MYARQSVRLGAWAWGHMGICHSASQQKKKKKKQIRPLGRGGVTRPSLGRIPRDTYVQICTPPYTYKHVGTRMYTYVHERTHMYSYVRARTHTYSYVHARTRTFTYVRVPWDSPQLGTPPTRGSDFFFFAGWLAGGARWPGWQCWLAVPFWQCPYCQEYQ